MRIYDNRGRLIFPGAPASLSYLTQNNEVSALPNSLRLLAGTNITLTAGTNTLTVAASGGSGPSTAFKSVDTSRANTSTLADDPHLTFSGLAAGTYTVTGYLQIRPASSTPGFKLGMRTSNAPTADSLWTGISVDANIGQTSNSNIKAFATAPATNAAYSIVAGLLLLTISIEGQFEISSTTDLALQWAQNSSSANAVVLLRGSWMSLYKLT